MTYDGIEIDAVYKPIRTLRLKVKADGSVSMSIPFGLSPDRVSQFLEEHRDWLHETVAAKRKQYAEQQKRKAHAFEEGEVFSLFGTPYTLRFTARADNQPNSVYTEADRLCIAGGADLLPVQRRKLIEQWLLRNFSDEVERLLALWLPRMDEDFVPISWVPFNVKTRWGTCKPLERFIRLNIRLLYYPRECLEYVVVHELCHLKEPSHNACFHALMNHYLPDYKRRKQLLRQLP
ncbi:MAG: M48 family metallopeptidase [Alloprevotella sp.]